MWHGDRSRKQNLVDYGFRLPSAMDNRPLKFEEFENRVHQTIYVSATPGPYELTRSAGVVVEQVIRPTGLVDPAGRDPARQRADRRSAGRDPRPRQAQRTRAGYHVDQAHGRRPGRLLHRSGRALPLHALGDRDAGTRQAAGRPAQGRVRRAHRHQPAARGPRPAGSLAGRHSGRGQGRFPALFRIADPDHGPRGAPRRGQSDSVRRQDDGLHAPRARRDQPPPRNPDAPTTRSTASRRSR